MIFDKLAAIVERYVSTEEVKKTLRNARIFVFEGKAHEVLPQREIDSEEADFLRDNFFLPFPCIAIEDGASCVILQDIEKDAKGIGVPRLFIECIPMDADLSNFRPDGLHDAAREMQKVFPKGTCLISSGWFKYDKIGTSRERWRYGGDVGRLFFAHKKLGVLFCPDAKTPELVDGCKAALQNISAAFEEVMYFNSPNNWVLEKRPAKTPKRRKENQRKIPRSHNRPQYTLLNAKKIRQVMGLSEPTGESRASPTPHERRKHFRTFRSERFTKQKGKTIVIPAMWIGPSEAKVGRHVYKVRLDL